MARVNIALQKHVIDSRFSENDFLGDYLLFSWLHCESSCSEIPRNTKNFENVAKGKEKLYNEQGKERFQQ